ncbi:hypothetical protein QP246_02385 [Aerococcus urinae]|uniref:hypothetical protein n=1 Tax=Aerococcus urinae TaxID=1376 RepID=UPI00254C6212|nr:hypothetical protein [Aerococcus urinae]MDK6688307.1 hypothetical protein [Aerococcus urinae]
MAITIVKGLRVRRIDPQNVVLEKLEKGVNPKTKEGTESWVRKGYYRNLRQALSGLRNKDGLIPYDDLKTVEGYIKALKEQDQIIAKTLGRKALGIDKYIDAK